MINIQRNLPCPHCGRYLSRYVTVNAIIIREDKLLLIKRGVDPYKGFWSIPGGYVDWDESTEEAVEREVKEETGLSATVTKLVGVYGSPRRHPKQVINISYLVEVVGTVVAGDDAVAAKWFSLNDLPTSIAFDHAKIISEAVMHQQVIT